jgi:hypothetical protein
MRSFACGALAALAILASAGRARAQSSYVEHRTNEMQQVTFVDDPMGAVANDPIGTQLWAFHPPRRFDLMRPRCGFVPEMLKSVENM